MEYQDEHIYENVSNRYKYKLFNGILSSFTSKAKDLNLRRKRDKHILNNNRHTNLHHSDENHIDDDDDDDNDFICKRNHGFNDETRGNSYTPCEDENIYENLEFLSCAEDSGDNFSDDNNCAYDYSDASINDWMMNLSNEISDYETENFIFIKSIPSVFSGSNLVQRRRKFSKTEITMSFLKTLWNIEHRADMMNTLLQTFANLLQQQNIFSASQSSDCATKSVCFKVAGVSHSLKKLKESKYMNRKHDKRSYQILVHLILSTSLNSLMITYSKSEKVYFTLAHSGIILNLPSDVHVKRIVSAINFNFKIKFRSHHEKKEFVEALKLILERKKQSDIQNQALNRTQVVTIVSDTQVKNKIIKKNDENIYQQIWKFQTISNDDRIIMNDENDIYDSFEDISNDKDWEVTDEFSFMSSENQKIPIITEKMIQETCYQTVWVLYDNKSPELNQIYYNNEPCHSTTLSERVVIESLVNENNSEKDYFLIEPPEKVPEKYFESVMAWKNSLRNPDNYDDEDDVVSFQDYFHFLINN
jgi:hypothetical protein